MGIAINLKGKRIGKLKILNKNGHDKHGNIMWKCKCDCGHIYSVVATLLNRKIINNCHHCSNKLNTGSNNKLWTGYGEISGNYMYSLKSNAKKRNIMFDLTVEYLWKLFLKQNKKCALSGLDLKFNSCGNKHDGNASLDRINNKLGYTIKNVQWIDKDINWLKQDFDEKYFIEMCQKISLHFEKK